MDRLKGGLVRVHGEVQIMNKVVGRDVDAHNLVIPMSFCARPGEETDPIYRQSPPPPLFSLCFCFWRSLTKEHYRPDCWLGWNLRPD